MSTILDALRKIEGERQGPDDERRARVLARPPRPPSPAPSLRSLLWAAGMSSLLVGFAVGVWMTRQAEIPPEEGRQDFSLSSAPENSEEPEKTVSAVTQRQFREEQQREEQHRTGSGPDPLTPALSLVLPAPPPLQDSPFVPSTQVALRTSLVDASPQGFSEPSGEKAHKKPEALQRHKTSVPHLSKTADEGLGATLQSEHGEQGGEAGRAEQERPLASRRPADIAEPDESEDIYASAPANSAVSFLQWSPESARRKALVRVEGSPLTLVHEGDSIDGYTVVEIRPDAVALRSGTTRFQLRVR